MCDESKTFKQTSWQASKQKLPQGQGSSCKLAEELSVSKLNLIATNKSGQTHTKPEVHQDYKPASAKLSAIRKGIFIGSHVLKIFLIYTPVSR